MAPLALDISEDIFWSFFFDGPARNDNISVRKGQISEGTIMRTYERTHPWINFDLPTSRFGARLWMLLGEAQSKCQHIAGVPLRPDTADQLYRLYLVKGVMATTAIEGNTLSEDEVQKRMEGKLELPPSREYLGQEVDNIQLACSDIIHETSNNTSWNIIPEMIKKYNKAVLTKLDLDDHVQPGEIRNVSVGVARYRGAPPEDCEYLLARLCEWMNHDSFKSKETLIVNGLLRAIMTHLYIAWIHPFGDGNGRTARLLELYILIVSGAPLPAVHLLSNHYNLTRQEYYRQLQRASESRDVIPFITYAVQGFVDGLKEQLAYIRDQQWDIIWRNYVHELFRDKNTKADIRRKRLVLDLGQRRDFVPVGSLKEISPRVSGEYANKTAKTITRDLRELSEMNLITKTRNGVRANRELILAFLPPKRKAEDA